ncbi:MAG: glycosyltransferase [Saprospiraceae bacterium]|nr:glycosyltransferase [Saprospiraceae bacterium]
MNKAPISIYCTVTNDLNQDQRMHRICTSMITFGYEVTLIGRQRPHSTKFLPFPFKQHRLACYFQTGFLFYAEFNLRLFFYLLFRKVDIIYSVDLDTIAPCALINILRSKKLIFDAHEYFTETPELLHRLFVKKFWQLIGNIFVPTADLHITVNESLAIILANIYHRNFEIIYNVPALSSNDVPIIAKKPYILYQGVLNKGRGIKEMTEAMDYIEDIDLYIIGEGDLSDSLKNIVAKSNSRNKIHFLGWLLPDEIKKYTLGATLGLNLLDGRSQSYYYSLANKFFDYMHAEVPSVNMNFPEYSKIIKKFNVGMMIRIMDKKEIASSINMALNTPGFLDNLKNNCQVAKLVFNWQHEEEKLKKCLTLL